MHVVEAGLGSGVLSIIAEKYLNNGTKEKSTVDAYEISERAAYFAFVNAVINNAPGITIHLEDFTHAKITPKSVDAVIMNPPYNPTWPGLGKNVALHAAAGEMGQDLHEAWAAKGKGLIKEDGLLLGHMMFTANAPDDIPALNSLAAELGEQSDVHWVDHLGDSIPTEKFLNGQYDWVATGKKHGLNQWIQQVAKDRPFLSLVSYSASPAGGKGQVVKSGKDGGKNGALTLDSGTSYTWDDRITLHRKIVQGNPQIGIT